MTTSVATCQLHHLTQWAAAWAAISLVTTEFGKWVASRSSNISPSDCVRLLKRATRDPSLVFVSLERALCNLADMSRSLTELQKVLYASETFLSSFLYLHWASLYSSQLWGVLSVQHLLKSCQNFQKHYVLWIKWIKSKHVYCHSLFYLGTVQTMKLSCTYFWAWTVILIVMWLPMNGN